MTPALVYPEVPGTNNASEQLLRGAAQSRKLDRTRKSERGFRKWLTYSSIMLNYLKGSRLRTGASSASGSLEWATAIPTAGVTVMIGAAARLTWWIARGQALTIELSQLPTLDKLKTSLEDAIDARCVEIAKAQLSVRL